MDLAIGAINSTLESGIKGYICVTGVHGVMESQRDFVLKEIINNAFLVTPDGMPTVWVGKLQGYSQIGRVYGPDLMLEVCRMSVEKGYSHFIYGGKIGVAEELATKLNELFPGIKITGTYTPPFEPLTKDEELKVVKLVNGGKPDIIWVGLSTPKQEKFMAEFIHKLETKVMLGVGAAFDVHTGHINDAPIWMKNTGLQWLHRLWQEPRRLLKRYLINNPKFIYKISLQFLGAKKYSLSTR